MITIEQIKKLNAERTQGEWKFNNYPEASEFVISRTIINSPNMETTTFIATCFEPLRANAAFIAAAPAIAELAIQLHQENLILKAIEKTPTADIIIAAQEKTIASQAEEIELWKTKYEKLKEFVKGKWKGDCPDCAATANEIFMKEQALNNTKE